ncbi:hypothetical protein MF271_16530 [Deinococcus sp. KNUC1210]|uniref:hypothetical protein n=1 Tax=Deinococcus sp. KNUC1210 TaxID=2917691 RepID=UPI001EEFD84E|nr:hypothetical protein [Deinococcus sp. KNUC1210]ULH15497.1 hypothetical protein MF271_16530 [Deinococcus sp. KNUC1210]
MSKPIHPFRSLNLKPSELVQIDRLSRVMESTQLRMQQASTGGVSLISLVEQGQLTPYGAVLLIGQDDLAWAPRPLIRAGIDSLLARRQQYAAAVESGLPLPPLRQICGAGMIRATASGHLLIQGCSEPLEVDGGLPDWILSALQRQGLSELALKHSWLAEAGFGSGRWVLWSPQRIS